MWLGDIISSLHTVNTLDGHSCQFVNSTYGVKVTAAVKMTDGRTVDYSKPDCSIFLDIDFQQ